MKRLHYIPLQSGVLGAFDRLGGVLFRDQTSFTEIILALSYLGWSFIMLISDPDIFAISPSYEPMGDVAPAWVWGGVFLTASILKLAGNVCNVRLLRGAGAFIGFVLWAFISTMFYVTGNVPTGVVVYGLFALASLLMTIRHVYIAIVRWRRNG